MKQNRFRADYAGYDGGWRLWDEDTCIGRGYLDELALRGFVRFLNTYCGVTYSAREFVLELLPEGKTQ